MSSGSKLVLAMAVFLLMLSLPMKLLWRTNANAFHQNQLGQAERLHVWLEASRIPIERDFQPKPGIWHGWRIRLANCSVIALPQPDFDGTELLRRLAGNDPDLRYVYDGRISDQPPVVDTMIAKLRFVVAPFLSKPSDALVIVIAAPKGCRDYEALDWSRLWKEDLLAGV
jgi:hypothetical protein